MDAKIVAAGAILIVAGVVGILALTLFTPQSIGLDAAEGVARRYQAQFGDPDIAIDEIMEFELNYYVIYYEKSTGIGAFEMLIDKSTGNIFPEYGPNMMWNLKYGMGGMMGGWRTPPSAQMPIGGNESKSIAQDYLNKAYPGTQAEEVHQFYGYYTIHVTKDGKIFGMLSVDGYDGVVWYHSWHGHYIQSREETALLSLRKFTFFPLPIV